MNENQTVRQEGGGSGGAYRAFLLRCWQESGGEPLWRFTLVQVGNELTKKGFARLEDLITFLREDLDISPRYEDPGGDGI